MGFISPLSRLQRRLNGGGGGQVPGLYHAEAAAANTSAPLLWAEPWQRLLGRVGDALMSHLLTHAAIFAPLPNGNYLQLAGRSISEARDAAFMDDSLHCCTAIECALLSCSSRAKQYAFPAPAHSQQL